MPHAEPRSAWRRIVLLACLLVPARTTGAGSGPPDLASRLFPTLRAALGARGLELRSVMSCSDPGPLPAGELVAALAPHAPGGLNLAALDLKVARAPASCAEPEGSRPAAVRCAVEAWVPVLQAGQHIGAGERLGGNLRRSRRLLTGPTAGLLGSGEDPGRYVARRAIPARSVLRRYDVRPAPEVLEGETVRVVGTRGRLKLEATGVAQARGRTGEAVAVRVFQGGRSIRARVLGPALVEWTGQEAAAATRAPRRSTLVAVP